MTNIKKKRKELDMFKYLVPSMDEVEAEINAINIAGNKCYHALGYLLKKRHINTAIKGKSLQISKTQCNLSC